MAARPEALATVRTVTGALASFEGLDTDRAADLALAVDEACTVLIAMADAGTSLLLVEDPGTRELHVEVSATCDSADPSVDEILNAFSRRVLESLADDVSTFVDGADWRGGADDAVIPVLGISLTMRRWPAPRC
ncbi:ATP-binding protein [Mycobacterium sp. TNTM28]|uniref:ATP-binding protein n=1 Tax=[Mycobacterium] fortunisiensis TaxID=2600579 RepID=A0ABS6KL25_9MYCO|nr:ATP-binding protein [[Mycobacterium] fortunisiensis]MBU9763986.1 ATP-binding protein [[Mycobacterium] fortunisiensis]